MSEENEKATYQIKYFREMDYRQLEECASFLGVSTGRYKQIEENESNVTLPELELLSILFQTSVATLLNGDSIEKAVLPFNSSVARQQYKKLRNKMILAKIEIACQDQNISIQELLERLNLSVNALESYDDGIPRDHLLFICNELSLNIESFLEDAAYQSESHKTVAKVEHRKSEFKPDPSKETLVDSGDNDFDDLVRTIKSVPKDEQALLVRILLEELREF